MADELNLYEQERRAKLQKLRELGVDPFGGRVEGLVPLAEAKAKYEPAMGSDGGPVVRVAGRIVLKRDMGKLSFLTLRDDSGDLQVGLDKKRLGEREWEVRGLLDLGDQIALEGPLGATNKGETTVWATSLSVASKALLPPPAKWEGLTDVEARYRQRYVDLWANPQVMKTMRLRIRIIEEIRAFLKARGFEEVETPMLQPIHGGAAARPFKTHHNALDMRLFLRIAPELYLKRLLVGGMPKVFEINRNFRNEGISPRHNPEFTMLEAYEAYGSWETMADLVEEMITTVAQNVFGTLRLEHRDAEGNVTRTIDLARPWRRVPMAELVEERTGWRFDKQPIAEETLAAIRAQHPGKDIKRHANPAEQLTEIYEKLVEPTLIDPCYVTRVPGVIIPLARRCRDDDYFADVYELAINGQEISPGYSELNDPDVQAEQFRQQVGEREEQQQVDEDFLTSLKYGMPPAGGMGLGVDRLVMLLSGAESIRDVILFPLMRTREA
jgi:lysyl-tRNA synthetase class 2